MVKVLIFIQLIIICWLGYLNGYSLQKKDKQNESLTVRNAELVVNGNKLQIENTELVAANDQLNKDLKELNKDLKELNEKYVLLEEHLNDIKTKEIVDQDKLSLIDLKLENLTNRNCDVVYREKKVVEAKYDLLLKKTMGLIKDKKLKKEDFK